ncbi:hypothetical protein C8J57DRAFT_1733609 [Mycena rebaudengoi]|nr:hypothetical protein C8J57DRAFT_1733609 [Mycena rebaudengoi]
MSSGIHYKDWPNDAGVSTIPAYAAGILLRNGPGNHKLTTETGEFACSHWFDGFSHLYRFELAATPAGDCKVNYSSRRQVDGLIEQVRKTGKLEGVTFGQKVQFFVEIARKFWALTFRYRANFERKRAAQAQAQCERAHAHGAGTSTSGWWPWPRARDPPSASTSARVSRDGTPPVASACVMREKGRSGTPPALRPTITERCSITPTLVPDRNLR